MDDLTLGSQFVLESLTAKRKYDDNGFDQENDEVNGHAEKKVTEFMFFSLSRNIFRRKSLWS